MNTAYSEELIPPKELFSREWFDLWNEENSSFHNRIDETRRKLEGLELKIRERILKSGGYTQNLLIDTITLLDTYIGVWNVYTNDTVTTNANGTIRTTTYRWEIKMTYPDGYTRSMENGWNELVLGKVQREGVFLVMLSTEAVEWLNEIAKFADYSYIAV